MKKAFTLIELLVVIAIIAIPYYANSNHGPVKMAVWIPQEASA